MASYFIFDFKRELCYSYYKRELETIHFKGGISNEESY